MCYSILEFWSHRQRKTSDLHSSAIGKNTLLFCCHEIGMSIQLLLLSYGTVTWTAQNTCQIKRFVELSPTISAFWIVFSSCMNSVTWLSLNSRGELHRPKSWTGKGESNLIWWLVNPIHELQAVWQHDTFYKALSLKFVLLSEPTDFADSGNKNPNLS